MLRSRPALVLVLFTLAAGVIGQTAVPRAWAADDDTTKAKEHFAKARIHYDLKEWEGALQEFKDAYRYAPDPVFLYNIAQCHVKLGQNREAVDFFHNYLRRAPTASNRADVERRIAELEATLRAAPPTTGLAPPTTVTPPVSSSPPTRSPIAPPPSPAAPTNAAVAPRPLSLSPPTAPSTTPTRLDLSTAPAPEASPPIYQRWWFWTGVAVVALGTVGIIAVAKRGEIGDCMRVATCKDLRP